MPSPQPSVAPSEWAISVEAVVDPAALPALAAEWEKISPSEAPGAVFRSAAWLLPWWKTFSVGREAGRTLRILTVRRGGQLIGALPCYRETGRLGVRTLKLLGDNVVGSDYLGLIAKPGDAREAALLLAERIASDEEDVHFGGMLPDEPIAVALSAAADNRGHLSERIALLPCPFLDIAGVREKGLDFAAWLKTLPNGAGAQLLRRRRWLEKQPGFVLEIADTEAAIAAGMEDLFRVHEARWAEEGGSDGITSEDVKGFHRVAAAELARRGQARIYLLKVEGTVRAALYGFESGGRFAFYQSGNDPEWRQRSVGTVVLGAAIEDSFRRGLVEFDFLRGGESYKALFASDRRELVTLRTAASTRARALRIAADLEKGARASAKRILPESAIEWIRKQRRVLSRATSPSVSGSPEGQEQGQRQGEEARS